MRQRGIAFVSVLLATSLAWGGCSRNDERPPEVDIVPLLALPDAHGERFDPATLEGKRVLVNFWSVSCGSCIKEMPALQAATEASDDTALVLVTVDGPPGRAEATARANGVRAPVLMGDRALASRLSVRQVPTTFVIDREGRAQRVLIGERDRRAFQRALDDL